MKKNKILRIITRLNIGGPAVHAILLSEGLNNDRFTSILVSGVVDRDESDMMYLADEKNVKPIIFTELSRKIHFLNDLVVFFRLFFLICKEKPDIIHTHTAKAGTLGRLAALIYNWIIRRKRFILIHTFHGHVLHSYFGKFKTKIFIIIERFLAKFTDTIITVSNSVKKELIDLKICNPKKLRVIPLGLELDGLMNIDDSNNSEIRVAIIGRLVPIKNHIMFLKAARKLLSLEIGIVTKFIVVGDGELMGNLKENSHQMGLDNNVIFTGWQRNLENLYSNLDIVVTVSLNEGTPVSLIEAMAAARPVVATNVGGVKDLIKEERGFLVESGDVDGLVLVLRRLIEDKQLRIRQGLAGREFVRNLFTKERLIEDIKILYEDLLKED